MELKSRPQLDELAKPIEPMNTQSQLKPDKMEATRLLGADWWNDSCDLDQLAEAVAHGATGATSNPVIVQTAVAANEEKWLGVAQTLAQSHPDDTAEDITWKLIAEMGRQAAAILKPVYDATRGAKGYLSLQVNPANHLNAEKMFEQAVALASLAPNIAIKLPTTAIGLSVAERLTAKGIAVNTTVSFSVAQAVAAAEAIERGLATFARNGGDPSQVHPYATIMVGRVGDYLNTLLEPKGVTLETPDALFLSGTLVFKHAARVFKERGFQTTLLSAAYRHECQWSQIVGKEVLQSIPYAWWQQFRQSDWEARETLWESENATLLAELRDTLPEFDLVYEENGLAIEQFQTFAATQATLAQFVAGYESLVEQIRQAIGK